MLTNAKQIRVFEKTLIGGYSCVNTRMAFDTELILKDLDNEKVIFKIRDGELKRFSRPKSLRWTRTTSMALL